MVLYIVALVTHVSAATGTFAADRTAHPTYWSIQLGGVPVFRGAWLAGSSYTLGDIVVVDDYEYFLCTESHIADVTFPGNGAAWQTIFDATEVVTDATDAAAAAAGSASSAFTSATMLQLVQAMLLHLLKMLLMQLTLHLVRKVHSGGTSTSTPQMANPGIADVQFNNAQLVIC